MSSDWPVVEIDDVCAVGDGAHSKVQRLDQGTLYLTSKNIGQGELKLEKVDYISEDSFSKLFPITSKATRRPEAGDVLLGIIGTFGNAYIYKDSDNFGFSSSIGILRPNKEILDSKYLYYVISSPKFKLLHAGSDGGSVQGYTNIPTIKKLPLPLPPLVVQESIADLLGTLDDRITLLRETNATLEAIAQALFKSWFVDFDPVRAKAEGRQPEAMDAATAALFPDSFEESELGLVPSGWRVVRLGDVTERITKGTTPTTLKCRFVESGINFVKVESLTDDGQLLPNKFAYIDDETHKLLARSQLKAGDVLITIAGTIGRVAVITDDFIPANTNQAVALVRPDSSKLPSVFISQFLRLSDSKARMGERVVQAVQANLSLGSLSDMKLVMPPSEVVAKLHEAAFDIIESNKISNQQRIQTLTQLRDTLLPRLISGQLRLPEVEACVEEALA